MRINESKKDKTNSSISFKSDYMILNFDEQDWIEKRAKGFVKYIFLFPFALLVVWVGLNLTFKRNVLFLSNYTILLITLVMLLSNLRRWLWREYQYSQKLNNKAISTLKGVIWGYIVPILTFLAVVMTFEKFFTVF